MTGSSLAGNPPAVMSFISQNQSQNAPYREIILGKLEEGLSVQRIWQDLVGEHGFADGYQSVQRFVRRLQSRVPFPFRRMETPPGEQAQIDFGVGIPVILPEGEALTLLLYSYCMGAYSSRRIQKLCERDAACRVIVGNDVPNFRTISGFRKEHLPALQGLFVQVLMLCRQVGLLTAGLVSLDGTKVKANTSRHKAMTTSTCRRKRSVSRSRSPSG